MCHKTGTKMYENLINMLECPFITPETKAEIKQVLEALGQKVSTGIRLLTDEFVRIAKLKNITLYYNNEHGVDSDIFNWLPNSTVTETPPPAGVWKSVDTENGTNEKTMQESAIKMSLSQAVVKFTKMLKNGEFDKKETYRIIFLTETKDGNPLKLLCRRNSDGKLYLYVYGVYPDFVWRGAGSAWFGSNKSLKS